MPFHIHECALAMHHILHPFTLQQADNCTLSHKSPLCCVCGKHISFLPGCNTLLLLLLLQHTQIGTTEGPMKKIILAPQALHGMHAAYVKASAAQLSSAQLSRLTMILHKLVNVAAFLWV